MSHPYFKQLVNIFNGIDQDAAEKSPNMKFMFALAKALSAGNRSTNNHHLIIHHCQQIAMAVKTNIRVILTDSEIEELATAVANAIHVTLATITKKFPSVALEDVIKSDVITGMSVELVY